ncbi:PilZ domain-containing protein [Pseudaminobacter soli (ex Zhang et al. 2022)]
MAVMKDASDESTAREHRQRVLKGATIIIDLSKSEISCTIRNQHSNGAELRVPLGVEIPTEFTLYVPTDGVAYYSKVRWRRGERVGVQFTGSGPKPKHHYG